MWRFLALFLLSSLVAAGFPSKENFPKKIRIKKDLFIEQVLPNGKIAKNFKAGSEFDLITANPETAAIRSGVFTKTVPISDTDFHESAAEVAAKAEERRTQLEMQKLQEQKSKEDAEMAVLNADKLARVAAGDPVVSESENGAVIHPAIYKAVRDSLKDPDSFQPRQILLKELKKLEDNSYVWNVALRFGAKNGFGGYTMGTAILLFRGEKAVLVKIEPD
jgi:hypothetical protein